MWRIFCGGSVDFEWLMASFSCVFVNGGCVCVCVCYLCGVCCMSHCCAMSLCVFYNLTHSSLTWFTTHWQMGYLSLPHTSIHLSFLYPMFLPFLMSVHWALHCDLNVVCLCVYEKETGNMYVGFNLHFFKSTWLDLHCGWLLVIAFCFLCASLCTCVSPQGDSLYSWETLYAWKHTQPGFYNSSNWL